MNYYQKYLKYKKKYNQLKNNFTIKKTGGGYTITLKRIRGKVLEEPETFVLDDFLLENLKIKIAQKINKLLEENISEFTHEIIIVYNGSIVKNDSDLIKICSKGTCNAIYLVKKRRMINIKIKTITNDEYFLMIPFDLNIERFYFIVKANLKLNDFTLIYQGKKLNEMKKKITDYNIVDNSVINLVLNLKSGSEVADFMEIRVFDGYNDVTMPDGTTFKGTFKDGRPNGYIEVYKNKKILAKGNFVDGNLEGEGEKYDYLNDNIIKEEGVYKMHQLNGPGKRFINNILSEEGMYIDNLLDGTGKKYNTDGVLTEEGRFTKNYLNGYGKRYRRNGIIIEEGIFRYGELHSGKTFDEDGKLFLKGTFLNYRLEGEGEKYDDDGKLYEKGQYKEGELNGWGLRYSPDGSIVEIGIYKNNLLNGKGVKLNPDGTIIEKGIFENNILKKK